MERRDDGTYKWDNFKIIAELTRKTDEALSTYIEKLIELSHRTNAYCEQIGAKKGGTTDTDASIVQVMAHPDYPKTDDGESISWDRAKKVIKRIEIFDRLRLSVLMMPDVSRHCVYVSWRCGLQTLHSMERLLSPNGGTTLTTFRF